ncbi:hypothetical protein HPP92_004408 [Vanilla planifolia]|uniref:Uncharacterized protein n=1 Tax=Vanilla planifolia TaxID=51239 RepID=A0A835RKZ5_VANPL|nr:hypothetical protein HPP92_004408 [Vanilla planifolia]
MARPSRGLKVKNSFKRCPPRRIRIVYDDPRPPTPLRTKAEKTHREGARSMSSELLLVLTRPPLLRRLLRLSPAGSGSSMEFESGLGGNGQMRLFFLPKATDFGLVLVLHKSRRL